MWFTDNGRDQWGGAENAFLLRHFVLKIIILPRQARDKHRESKAENKDALSLGVWTERKHAQGSAHTESACAAIGGDWSPSYGSAG